MAAKQPAAVVAKALDYFFAFEPELRAIPSEPTHCRGAGCVRELEPLRRWGGLCAECVASRARPVVPATEQLRGHMRVLRTFYKQRLGHRDKYAELLCDCGVKRVIRWSTWVHHRPAMCQACRLRAIERRGFEAEYAR